MFIDVHTHAFHPKIAHKVVDQLENHYSISPVGNGQLEDLTERLDRAGIDKAVVLAAATSGDQVIPANNWAIHIKETYPSLIPFGTIHPDFDRLESELDRLQKNNITGLKFHPDFQGFRMDDPALYEIMEMMADRFICLFHVGDTLPPEENPSCPKKLAKLHRAFPNTPIIAAHMGGYRQWEYSLEHLADTNVYVDSSSVMDFVDDSLLKQLFDSFGSDRTLFGSDYPLYDPASEIDRLKSRLHLSETALESLLNNASHLLCS
ncbi:amidohydrolase family protein [uncultured Pseudodesulfovibrio sp.]|uniref:amidohydrolase family protein n=1 Tax=uncultured Pseudodesulfovibrio sp. TaxID=2035858 RepID=UPI0029C6027A|nr:amidohydrolase family protein [uncultured Pseudodesulfovibrio sp.]